MSTFDDNVIAEADAVGPAGRESGGRGVPNPDSRPANPPVVAFFPVNSPESTSAMT